MALFKSKEEKAQIKFEKGADLIAQKKFDEAKTNLIKSIDKGNADPEVYILMEMLDLRENYDDVNQLAKAMAVLSKYTNKTVKYGVHDVNSTKLLNECKLRIDANKALGAADAAKTEDAGKELIRCGNEYMSQIGDENLIIEEIFSEEKTTGRAYALLLNARGYETLAQALKWDDPKKAADYSQQAANYRRDRNEIKMADANERFVAGLAKTVHCWFCGKEVSGEDVHFVPMESKITKPILEIINKNDLPIKSSGPNEIYACRACFSAIDNRDKEYHEKSKAYTNDQISILRREVYQQIKALDAKINDVDRRLNGMINAWNKSR